MRLRVKDVDFDRHVIIVREAKGNKDRVVMLPRSLAPALRQQMMAARALWQADRQAQRASVQVPDALEVKYPRLGQTWVGAGCSPRLLSQLTRAAALSRGINCMRSGYNAL